MGHSRSTHLGIYLLGFNLIIMNRVLLIAFIVFQIAFIFQIWVNVQQSEQITWLAENTNCLKMGIEMNERIIHVGDGLCASLDFDYSSNK